MSVFRNIGAAAALLLLTACAGGGGGDDPPVAEAPPSFQDPNSTTTYHVSSAPASFDPETGEVHTEVTHAEGTGSTITMTTDEAGRISELTFDIQKNDGSNVFHQTYSDVGAFSRGISLNDMATSIQAVLEGGTGANGFLMSMEGLTYAAFGGWAYNAGANDFRMGMLAGGHETPDSGIPASGSATYTGATVGAGTEGTDVFAFRGDARVVADFASKTVGTTFSNLITQNVATGAAGSLPTISGNGRILNDSNGTYYATVLDSNGYLGAAKGVFYGPNAEETAGAWIADYGLTSLVGSFGARR